MTDESTPISYKGFDKDLSCRGHQYEIGETYQHDGEIELCGSGFHACKMPLDVFTYYPPSRSRYCIVKQSGETEDGGDKTVSSQITVKAEIKLFELIKAQIDWVFKQTKIESADEKTASATGDQGAASATGYQGAASATGTRGAASATGYQGAASATGDQGAASATGDQGAASATGTRGAASATGYQGAASATGEESIACGLGLDCKAKAAKGSWIALAERDENGKILNFMTALAGRDIKPDTWYWLKSGKFVECE